MLKFYVRNGMIVDEFHETISFKQSERLEKNIKFKTRKRKKAKKEIEKDFYKFFNNAFYGKTVENVRNRLRIENIEKIRIKKTLT